MYTNLIKELEKRGFSLLFVSKYLGIAYKDLTDKLLGVKEFTSMEQRKLLDLLYEKITEEDYFYFLFSRTESLLSKHSI